MRKISVLSGAIKNAGDFLILDSLVNLLRKIDPACELLIYNRLESLDDKYNELNSSDCIILAGGPLILPNLYPGYMPFVRNLDDIKVPIYMVGVGWYGKNNLSSTIYHDYKLESDTIKLIKMASTFAPISCRDNDTIRLLRNQGIENVIMTGCPAWYCSGDYNLISSYDFTKLNDNTIDKICISDSGYNINVEKSLIVAEFLREKYPNSNLNFVFHRGLRNDSGLYNRLKELNITIIDISDSSNGFKVYDDCDLHVGFRLHSHIYNLSHGNKSILIEEDGRGIAFNETVGLKGIKPYSFYYDNNKNKCVLINNEYMKNEIDDLLFLYKKNNYIQIRNAINNMRETSEIMIDYLKCIMRILIK